VSTGFAAVRPGTGFGPFTVTVSPAANERYWRAAGVDHPRLRGGALYPPIAANLTILAFAQACPDAMIQTRQRLVCHRSVAAGTELVVTGAVTTRYEKRGRDYIDVEATITPAGEHDPLWTSIVTFTPASTLGAPS
jgi:hypothetical protein